MRDRVPQQSTPSPIQALSVRLMRSRERQEAIARLQAEHKRFSPPTTLVP